MRQLLLAATALVACSALASPSGAQEAPLVLPGAGAPQQAPQQAGGAPQMPPNMVPLGPAAASPPPLPQGYVPQVFANPQQGMPQGMAPQQAAPGPQVVYPQGWAPAPQGYPPAYAQPGFTPPGMVASPGPQVLQPNMPMPPGFVPGPQMNPPAPADLAFQQALGTVLPMTDEMVRQFRSANDRNQRTLAAPASGVAARPVSRSITMSLRAGERAPTLRLAPGNATVVTFSDMTGASWPVASVTSGNPGAYNVQEAGEKGKTNMIVVSPLVPYATANMVVTLVGHPVPILFSLETGKPEVDYRLDVAVGARGPNALISVAQQSSLAPTNDPTVQSFIDGVAPRGARRVRTSNPEVEAWRYQDMVYVRTQMELLSPAYVGRARHVSGVNVYTLSDAPVLIVSQDGRMASVTVDR